MQTMKLILLTVIVTLACLPDLGLCQDPRAAYARACIKKGLMCETCAKAVFCIPDTDPNKKGQFVEKPNSSTTCADDLSCDELVGGCVLNGICRFNDQFHCPHSDSTDTIKYPDPYNCKNYYECPGRKPESKACDGEKVFDPTKKDCADKSGDLCKDYPVPLCKEKGQSGVIAGSNYSYECIQGFDSAGIDILYPMFNPVDSAPTAPTTTASTTNDTTTAATASTTSSANPSETTTIGTTSTQPGYQCPGVGNYADPSKCNCFHMCYMYAGKIQEKYTCCRAGSHFSEGAQRCVAGDDC